MCNTRSPAVNGQTISITKALSQAMIRQDKFPEPLTNPTLLFSQTQRHLRNMNLKNTLFTAMVVSFAAQLAACGSDSNSTTNDEPPTCNDLGASELDEGFVGDLSDDRAAPNTWALGAGANELKAGTSAGDLDYVNFTVGTCDTLVSITVNAFSFNGGDEIAFIAMQRGSTFTVTPETAGTRIDELLGYRHFGTANINADILSDMGQAENAIGFTSPLPSGNYTLWLNQVGPSSEYTLGFNVSRVSAEP